MLIISKQMFKVRLKITYQKYRRCLCLQVTAHARRLICMQAEGRSCQYTELFRMQVGRHSVSGIITKSVTCRIILPLKGQAKHSGHKYMSETLDWKRLFHLNDFEVPVKVHDPVILWFLCGSWVNLFATGKSVLGATLHSTLRLCMRYRHVTGWSEGMPSYKPHISRKEHEWG